MSSKPLVAAEPVLPSTPPATTTAAADVPSLSIWHGWLSKGATTFFLLALFIPGFLYADEPFYLNLFTRYACYALFAVGVDLIWGYTGLLSLGQGLFFGMGAYAVGYSLILQKAEQRGLEMPDFMFQCRLESIPPLIAMFHDTWVGVVIGLTVPTIIALILGFVMFQRRIKGVYFSLFTQALVLAMFMLVNRQRPYCGGVDGLTYLARFNLFGYEFDENGAPLFFMVTGILVTCFIAMAILLNGKFGKVLTAIRDNEFRVMALGYNTAMYKTFAYVIAGFFAGLAGALYTAANRSAGPQWFSIAFSIEIVIYVAVGGRGTMVGAILGTLVVNVARTYLNDNGTAFSEFLKWFVPKIAKAFGHDMTFTEPAKLWPIWLGAMFIFVVLFMPDGIIGLLKNLTARITRRFQANPQPTV
jgi:urea transport system permease protein